MSQSPELNSALPQGDGAVDSVWRRTPETPVASIFVHAGAGYHSVANEKVHLKACTDAARLGMAFLKAGATATEAVEAAIRCLEDRDITNAGFGSNLNIDGVVECDATIVDHLGRSGACGSVPGVKNPISLAKKILDTSSQPLSLRRVPPNILVGQGAKEFADEHGIKTVRNEYLVSRNAKDRYLRWAEDLRRAEARKKSRTFHNGYWIPPRPQSPADCGKPASPSLNGQLRDHANAILTATWNEGQPDSPDRDGSPVGGNGPSPAAPAAGPSHSVHSRTSKRTTPDPPRTPDCNPLKLMRTASPSDESHSAAPSVECTTLRAESPYLVAAPSPSASSAHDGPGGDEYEDTNMTDDIDYYNTYGFDASGDAEQASAPPEPRDASADIVTDTVGAIAIDLHGNIAAGSSSGGIGMKHRGRTGPAALVGVGTAVVPADPDDDMATSVAAVTSGTGEHMATCSASGKCAERLYQGTRRGLGGRDIPEEDEHAILESFVVDDFMGHPGVRNQPSVGAIGVMAVKKDRGGAYFYFAHNTDSFALASMSSAEREPLCVMSRLGRTGPVAQGARRVRVE